MEENNVEAIQSLYKMCRCYVTTRNNKSEKFIATAGVKQGDIVSPNLFIILMDDVFRQIQLKMRKYQIGSWKMKPINISELVYADDTVLFARSQANMQRNLEILNSELLARNMLINYVKTKIMMIGRSKKSCIVNLMGKNLEQVEHFKYLGVIINENGKTE
jgi:retron-type reverse transcriptase